VPSAKRELLRRGRRYRRAARLALLSGVAAGALLIAPGAGGVPGDPTPPVVVPTLYGTLGANGWYVSNVTLNWSVSDPESPDYNTSGCDAVTFSTDTPSVGRTCSATSDGGTVAVTKTVKIDKTPPAVSGAAARAPDANGWFNHTVTVVFSGTDPTSGVANCSSATYGGPDNPAAVVTGTCRNHAGHVGSGGFSLKYDTTPPSVASVRTKPWNRGADITWQASPDTHAVELSRAPGVNGAASSVVYSGTATSFRDAGLTAGRKYTYMVAAADEAGNRAGRTATHVGTGALLTPAPAERVSRPPLLTWTAVKGASYYNVQILRGARVLSAWPTRTSLRLKRTWTMNGRRYRLRPGVYRWYVWPGYGRLAASKYGSRLGGSTFVVRG
jgi:hypothetical protein